MLAALLGALLCAPAATAAAADLGELERLRVEFSTLSRHIDDDLALLSALRASVLDAPEPEARLLEAQRALIAVNVAAGEAGRVRGRHRIIVQSLMAETLARGMFGARAHALRPESGDGKMFSYQDVSDEMHAKTDVWTAAIERESFAIKGLNDAFAARQAARRRRRIAGWAAAGLAALLALAWRYVDRPNPQPSPPPGPRPPPVPKTVAGNFSLVGLLGRGSMGEVYEAVDTSLNRRTALKRLRQELLQDPADLEGLLKEARLMAALKHPNLVSIYSIVKDAGQVYIAMEFVEGASLQRRLDAESRLPWPEALRIARGVGAALDYAHGMKVVHRDLKPANVMLSVKGEVKVMDFGIAYQAAKSVSRLTRAPTWGTPPYMAPEQELGGVSAAVDIYALSVCLYEMLTGELPFKGPNFLAQKREALWTPPGRLVPGLPDGVDGLFAVALAPEPSRRFKSAAALLTACDALNS